jgi:hypothetical protein
MLWIIIGSIILFFVLVSFAPPSDKSRPKYVDIDVPNPTVASPGKVLKFINECDPKLVYQVEMQLDNYHLLKGVIYRRAFMDKHSKGSIDVDYYLKIFDKIEKGNYSIEDNLIPDNYKFALTISLAGGHISDRKERIIFYCDEGEEVELIPEPNNPYDKHAIRVECAVGQIGYIPRYRTFDIAKLLKFETKTIISDIIYNNNDDQIDVYLNIYKSDTINDDAQFKYTSYDREILESRKIESQYLKPKKVTDEDDVDMFFKKKVIITGTFVSFPDRNDIAKLLYESGADIDTSITERTDYVIVGNDPGWRKMERIEELGITTFSEEEFKKIYGL